MNFKFPQSYYIKQLLKFSLWAMISLCLLDKHKGVKIFSSPSWPDAESKESIIFEFHINLVFKNFNQFLHANEKQMI